MKYSKQEKKWIKDHTTEKEREVVKEYLGKKKQKPKNGNSNPKMSWSQRTASKFARNVVNPVSYINLCERTFIPQRKYINVMWYVILKYNLVEKIDYLLVVHKDRGCQKTFDMWMPPSIANVFLDEMDAVYVVSRCYDYDKGKFPHVKKSLLDGTSIKLAGEERVSNFIDLGKNVLIPEFIESDRIEYNNHAKNLGFSQKWGSGLKIEQKDDIPKVHKFKPREKIIAANMDEWILLSRNQLLSNPTKAESLLYDYLDTLGIEYIPQKHIICNGKHYFADAFIPSVVGIVEMDGGYHYTPEQIVKDAKRDENIRNSGIKICHCDNDESDDITTFIDRINQALGLGIDAYMYVE